MWFQTCLSNDLAKKIVYSKKFCTVVLKVASFVGNPEVADQKVIQCDFSYGMKVTVLKTTIKNVEISSLKSGKNITDYLKHGC